MALHKLALGYGIALQLSLVVITSLDTLGRVGGILSVWSARASVRALQRRSIDEDASMARRMAAKGVTASRVDPLVVVVAGEDVEDEDEEEEVVGREEVIVVVTAEAVVDETGTEVDDATELDAEADADAEGEEVDEATAGGMAEPESRVKGEPAVGRMLDAGAGDATPFGALAYQLALDQNLQRKSQHREGGNAPEEVGNGPRVPALRGDRRPRRDEPRHGPGCQLVLEDDDAGRLWKRVEAEELAL